MDRQKAMASFHSPYALLRGAFRRLLSAFGALPRRNFFPSATMKTYSSYFAWRRPADFSGFCPVLLFHKRKLPPWAEKTLCLLVILAAAGCACLAPYIYPVIFDLGFHPDFLRLRRVLSFRVSHRPQALWKYSVHPVFTSATVLFLFRYFDLIPSAPGISPFLFSCGITSSLPLSLPLY